MMIFRSHPSIQAITLTPRQDAFLTKCEIRQAEIELYRAKVRQVRLEEDLYSAQKEFIEDQLRREAAEEQQMIDDCANMLFGRKVHG